MEAANALKKQMWAEAQIDKVRMKDDNINKSDFPSINGNKVETQYTSPAMGGNKSPLIDINVDNNNNYASPSTAENQKAAIGRNLSVEKPSLVQDHCTGPENPQTQLSAQYSKRSRSQLKSYISHIAEEMYVYRSLPLGQDRRRNRYWQFVASASCNDPGSGRIFVEYHDGNWRLIDSEEVDCFSLVAFFFFSPYVDPCCADPFTSNFLRNQTYLLFRFRVSNQNLTN